MKKIILFSVFAFCLSFVFAQTKTQSAAISHAGGLSKKDSMLCKEWKFVSIEEFGVEIAPNEKQKNDGVKFSADTKASVTHYGVTKTGTWTTDKGKTAVTVAVDNSAEKRLYRIKKLEPESMTLEYQDSVLIRTKFNYVPVTK